MFSLAGIYKSESSHYFARTPLLPGVSVAFLPKPMGVYYHPRLATIHELSPNYADNSKINELKFIDKAQQVVYIGFSWVLRSNMAYFVLQPLLHCVLIRFLSKPCPNLPRFFHWFSVKRIECQVFGNYI